MAAPEFITAGGTEGEDFRSCEIQVRVMQFRQGQKVVIDGRRGSVHSIEWSCPIVSGEPRYLIDFHDDLRPSLRWYMESNLLELVQQSAIRERTVA